MPFADSRRLTTQGAKSMMAAAIAAADEIGIAATVAIVDTGGHMMVLERMEGGRFHTVHSSTVKAVCAASNRRPTTTQGAQGQDLDTLHAIGLSPVRSASAASESAAATGNRISGSPAPRSRRSARKCRETGIKPHDKLFVTQGEQG